MQPRRRRQAKKISKFRAAAADQVIGLHLYTQCERKEIVNNKKMTETNN
jgi:hypothetical protein